jgi:hypothetical protein
MSFLDEFKKYDHKRVLDRIMGRTAQDVERALQSERPGIEEFEALISPAAEGYLEQMAERSHRTTLQRFGNNIQMYVPSTSPTNAPTAASTAASTPRTRSTGRPSPSTRSSGRRWRCTARSSGTSWS